MSVGYTVVIPDSRNRGQGMPVDYLVQFCIEKGITSIGMMYELHRMALPAPMLLDGQHDDWDKEVNVPASAIFEYHDLGYEQITYDDGHHWFIDAN